MRVIVLAILVAMHAPSITLAVEPDEILADPVLEDRAREISRNIRCMVCQNESIDDSGADLAKDLRILIREKITEGMEDGDIYRYISDRYGDFALFRPRVNAVNLGLYASGPLFLVVALLLAVLYIRRRKGPQEDPNLDGEELARVDALLEGKNPDGADLDDRNR